MLIHLLTDYLSILVGMQLYFYGNKSSPFTWQQKFAYILAALIGALLGSRLLAALEDPQLFMHPPSILYYYLNKTIIGGIIGGIMGIEIVKKIFHITKNTGDNVVIPLMIAIIIGRIGCQLTGVTDGTIGVPCDYVWCFEQGDTFRRHPIPLYEIIEIVLLLPLCFRWIKQRRFREGFVFRVFIIVYFLMRFFFEFLKETHPLIFSLSAIQIACLGFAVYYVFDSMRNGLYLPTEKRPGYEL